MNYLYQNRISMKKMTPTQLKQYVIVEAKKLMKAEVLNEEKAKILGQLKRLNENFADSEWTTSIMNASEVGDFIDNYLEGWNLQYDAPVDLGNGKVSIRHQEETEDVMNQMNHQNAEERLSNMDDKSNYSDLDENEFGDELERMKYSEY